MPKGENGLAQSKRTAPPPNFKITIFKLVSYCVQKGEKVVFSKMCLKFCLVKGKAFETGGENFKS
jgi:hypothetical protein